MRRLTIKQKQFIAEYIKTKNGSRSAMKVYNVKNYNTAHAIASQNLQKATIKDSIDKHLNSMGYNPNRSIGFLMENEEQGAGKKATASDSIRASELLLKLSGHLIERKQSASYNFNIDSMDKIELLKRKAKYDKLLNNK